MKRLAHLITIAFAGGLASGQEPLKEDISHKCCTYYGEHLPKRIYSFTSDAEAMDLVKSILGKTGLEPNFKTMAANVPNAAATVIGEERVILYNQDFMHRIKVATKTDWSGISILAHEIGHHLQGHTLTKEGSNHRDELEADKYSGWVVAKLGGTLDEAQIAISTITTEEGSRTHPPRSARLAAITNGWKQARTDGAVKAKIVDPDPVQEPDRGESLGDWFQRFWANQKVNHAESWVSDFDDLVDYCYHDDGLARREVLLESRESLINNFPTRSYRLLSAPSYSEFGGGEKLVRLGFSYDYLKTSGRRVQGTSHLHLILRRAAADGKWLIGGFDETVGGKRAQRPAEALGAGTPGDIGETVEESVIAFLNAHMGTMALNDAAKWAGMFSEHPYYCYSGGVASRGYLKGERAKLIRKYPERTYGWIGSPTLEVLDEGRMARVSFEISYQYRSPAGRFTRGIARDDLLLRWSKNRWLIDRFEERVSSR